MRRRHSPCRTTGADGARRRPPGYISASSQLKESTDMPTALDPRLPRTEADAKAAVHGRVAHQSARGQRLSKERGKATRSKKNPGKRH